MSTLRVGMLALAALCGGCMTVQMYDGPRRSSAEVARIDGDLRITAGAPLSVILRQVDGRTLNVGQTSAELLPGTHKLLVDCKIAETNGVTRHAIDVEVFAGRQYRLGAQTGPGLRECTNVELKAVD
jgi:hypothetical protein